MFASDNFFLFQFKLNVLEGRMAEFLQHMPVKKEQDISTLVIAPMPGMVKSVNVEVGQPVS